MRWLLITCALVACGDSNRPASDAAPIIDAPIDAITAFPCMSAAQCGGNACCMGCSPGGACDSICSADNMCRNFTSAMCDPQATQPCLKADGTPGVCTEQQFGPITTNKHWVCGSM